MRAGAEWSTMAAMSERLFSALLKSWRGERRMSQLALSLAAGVSTRHLAFLESGRAKPSAEMVLRLFGALAAPLREQNRALRAAGFAPRYPEDDVELLAPEIGAAIGRMMEKHEPYPLFVLSVDTTILAANRGARALLDRMTAEPLDEGETHDLLSLVFDPRRLRHAHVDWERLARGMLSRLQRDALARPHDLRLAARIGALLAYPGVPKSWKVPDFSLDGGPVFAIRLARGGLSLSFASAVTVFSAPEAVALDELRIESLFPLDDATHEACERFAREGGGAASIATGALSVARGEGGRRQPR